MSAASLPPWWKPVMRALSDGNAGKLIYLYGQTTETYCDLLNEKGMVFYFLPEYIDINLTLS